MSDASTPNDAEQNNDLAEHRERVRQIIEEDRELLDALDE